jgi:hypothetical protein
LEISQAAFFDRWKKAVMRCLFVLVLTNLFAGAALALAPDHLQALKAEFDNAVRAFEQEKAKARETALKRFDLHIQDLQKNWKIPASTRSSRVTELSADKERFEKHGVWPDNTALLNDAFVYSNRINKSYVPVAKAYERLMEACLKADASDVAQAIREQKARLDQSIRGSRFSAGSRWNGSRADAGGSTLFTIHVKKVTDMIFEGEALHNTGIPGHPIFEIGGVVNGNHISGSTTRVIRGKGQFLRFDGFIMDDKILMALGGIGSGGKPVAGSLVWLKCGS